MRKGLQGLCPKCARGKPTSTHEVRCERFVPAIEESHIGDNGHDLHDLLVVVIFSQLDEIRIGD